MKIYLSFVVMEIKTIKEMPSKNDRYGLVNMKVGEVKELRCKSSERDDLAKKIRGAIAYYQKELSRKYSSQTTNLGVAYKREA